MPIAYFEPLGRSWRRMKAALFKPFDIHKWFVVGFSAFLAGLADAHSGSGGSRAGGDMSFREFLDLPNRGWQWLMNHPGWSMFIAFVALVAIVVGIVLLWLTSRGKFMFLDNVVLNRAEIAKPWKEFRAEGRSLFLWRLGFGLIAFAVFAAFAVFFFVTARQLYEGVSGHRIPLPYIVGIGILFLLMLIIIGFTFLFLESFVVPLMYKNRIGTIQGWRLFLPLLGRHPFHFILFGLFMFVLYVLFAAVVIIAGLVSCCIGWLLLVIPYLGTVVTLPVWYTFRAFSIEFLEQFGPEFALFPITVAQPAVPPAQST
jgi:hypothetical protein